MMNKYTLLVILFNLLQLTICDDDTLIVKLDDGDVSGNVERTIFKNEKYFSFRSIPYAEPPVGQLRFLPPVPHEGWDGVYEAHTSKEKCVQYNFRARGDEVQGVSGSEDCLYLSVYTPSTEGSLPVIVFDYNDNFKSTFNDTHTYFPDFFLENDVIIVTISYRLGALGFLSFEDHILAGNGGLKDFILGLEWIKNNIKHFGGDPHKVTLMGNRGGAAIADILLYSHRATGLFSGVILQSGTSLEATYFPESPRQKAFKLGSAFNITTDDSSTLLYELQNVEAKDIVMKEPDIFDLDENLKVQLFRIIFSPTIEHEHSEAVLTSMPDHTRVVNDVPVMIGYNSRQGIDLASHFISEPRLVIDTGNKISMYFPIRSNYAFNRDSSIFEQALTEIKDFYFKEGEFTVNNIVEYATYVSDTLQLYAANQAVKKLSREMKSPIYHYVFDYRGALNENFEYIARNARFPLGFWGATIGDELCYLFVCTRIRKKYTEIKDLPSEQKEIKLLKKMVRMWANFAKIRNPTPVDDMLLKGVAWEPVQNEDNQNYLLISKQLQIKQNPYKKRMDFWDKFLIKYSKLAVHGVVGDHDEL